MRLSRQMLSCWTIVRTMRGKTDQEAPCSRLIACADQRPIGTSSESSQGSAYDGPLPEMYAPTGPDAVDIGAIVCDIGAHAARLGFAGEDSPRAQFPSHASVKEPQGMDLGNREKSDPRTFLFDLSRDPTLPVKSPMVDGLIDDWDMVEAIWKHACKASLGVDFSHTPVLLVEKAFNTPKHRQRYAELVFEKFQVPAMFMSKDSVLSAFACGKTTAVVVDVGAETTTVAPVQDGWLEAKAMIKSRVAGRVQDRYLKALLDKDGVKVLPMLAYRSTSANGARQKLDSKDMEKWHPSFVEYGALEVVRSMKESVCRMAEGPLNESDPKYASVPRVNYELPDGTVVATGLERFQVPEVLLNPEIAAAFGVIPAAVGTATEGRASSSDAPATQAEDRAEWSTDPLPKMIEDAVFRCERDQQSQLLSSIVLAGGSTCLEGMVDRIKAEVETAIYGQGQGAGRIRAVAAGPQERRICAWIGGSIMASLGTFHEMWVSKGEYAEHGGSIVDRKCP